MGAVEHLKTLCCLGLPPESAMISLTPLLHEIIPHGWTRFVLLETDTTATGGYCENPAAPALLRERVWRLMDDPAGPGPMARLGGELETAARYMDEGAAILAELAFMKPLSFQS